MKHKIEILLNLGITQKAIADRLGISKTSITRLVKNNVPISNKHESTLNSFLIEIKNSVTKELEK